MDKEKEQKYYQLLERMTDQANQTADFNREKFVATLVEFCELFHLAKGVTEFYVNPRMEAEGKGEILIDYDNGRAEVVILKKRIVTPASAIIIGTLYAAKEETPFPEDELEKIDIALRLLLGFIARNRLQRSFYKLAFFDADGFPNLRSFMKYAEPLCEKGNLYGYTAVCFNLKHFTLINQDIGRTNADHILLNYFNLLKDTIGDRGTVCRMGGDNFVMIFKNEATSELLDILAGTPVSYTTDNDPDKRVMISARAGVCEFPENYTIHNPGQIMETVYPAVQMAKQTDVSPVFFNQDLYTRRDKTMHVRRRFQEGLDKNEFQAYYQPKVNIKTGEVAGAEALCRWYHKDTLIMPMDFIPVLEMNMDICRLDFRILDIVCRDIRRWLDEGRPVVRISVNLSRKNLVDADLLSHILETVDRYNVPHELIEIELTETTTDVSFRGLSRIVNGLQQNGISTSVDDFGNGYSSLNLIRSIPWNVLKIDRSLLPIGNDQEAELTNRMYKHVVAMARDIGIACITEGVETREQVEILRENHCHIAQGFYFDRALPVEVFEDRLVHNPYPDMLK